MKWLKIAESEVEAGEKFALEQAEEYLEKSWPNMKFERIEASFEITPDTITARQWYKDELGREFAVLVDAKLVQNQIGARLWDAWTIVGRLLG